MFTHVSSFTMKYKWGKLQSWVVGSLFLWLSYTRAQTCLHTHIWWRTVIYIGGNDNIYEPDTFSTEECFSLLMSLTVYHYLWMKRRRKGRWGWKWEDGVDVTAPITYYLLHICIHYISSKLTAGDSGCHGQGSPCFLNSRYTSTFSQLWGYFHEFSDWFDSLSLYDSERPRKGEPNAITGMQ